MDYRLFKSKNTGNHLADRILYALEYFPCNLLLIHRDAEGRSRDERLQEITNSLQVVFPITQEIPSVCVVPVRMTEAWLLFSEDAIRYAAGNLSGLDCTPMRGQIGLGGSGWVGSYSAE